MKAVKYHRISGLRQFAAAFLALVLLLPVLAASAENGKDNRPVVTVQSLSTTEDMQKAIEDQCPGIRIKWYLSSQVHENAYRGLTDTPDILIRQAYYLDEQGSDYLRDVSSEEIAGNYSKNIIDSFRNADGALYWLPVLGSGYILAANAALFEKYGIPFPTDYESLVAADAAFKEHGIDGVAWGASDSYPYSAMLIASSIGADLSNSIDGIKWRNGYSSKGGDYTLDDYVWPEVFARFRAMMDCGLIDQTDMDASTVMASDALVNREAAMAMMVTSSVSVLDGSGDFRIIPLFDFNGDAWLPLYMSLRVGISANVPDSRMPEVLQVMRAITSTETYNAYNTSRGGVIPMNNDGDALPERMAGFKPIVDGGYTFMLVNDQNGGLIEGLSSAFHTMFTENLTAEEAYDLCCREILSNRISTESAGLNDQDASAVIFTSDMEYPLITDDTHNSPANSCIVNSLLSAINTYQDTAWDIMLMEGNCAGAPIRKGNYYTDANGESNSFSSNFYYLFNATRAVYGGTMTVGDLIQYLNSSFYHFHRIDDGLPIMAGASYRVEKVPQGMTEDQLPFTPNGANKGHVANLEAYPTCYLCTGIVKDGKELPVDQELKVLVGRVEMFYLTDYDKESPTTWVGFDTTLTIPDAEGKNLDMRHLLEKYLREGHSLAEPTQYVDMSIY